MVYALQKCANTQYTLMLTEYADGIEREFLIFNERILISQMIINYYYFLFFFYFDCDYAHINEHLLTLNADS